MIPFLLRNSRQLHILCADLFLHDLLQHTQRQFFRFFQRHILIVTLGKRRLRTLATGPDGLGFVSNERPGRIRKEELMSVEIVVAGDEERDAEGAGHEFVFVAVGAFAEGKGQIAYPCKNSS